MKKSFICTLIILSCGGGPSPKDTVFKFIDAVKQSDSTAVTQLIDIDSYIRSRMPEMTPEDSAQVLKEYRDSTIQSLLGEGDVRQRWLKSLIVVNKEVVQDTLAEVEVSFIDQSVGHQLYTRMQLRRQMDGSWKVIYFR